MLASTQVGSATYPIKCAHELFEERVQSDPNNLALVYVDRRVSYAHLNVLTNELARELWAHGLRRGTLVGVSLTSGPEAITALLAILKIGAVFVPLDRGEPQARLEYVSRDSGMRFLLTTSGGSGPVEVSEVANPCVGSAEMPSDNISGGVTLNDAACVLYTSGSAGAPKGVIRTHRGIVSRLAWMPISDDEIFCHNMPFGVGFSQERLFLPLMSGRPLVLAPERDFSDMDRLTLTLELNGVTQITVVPSSLRQLLLLGPKIAPRLRALRTVAVGGAELPARLIAAFQNMLPHATLINAYGSTEAGSVIRGPMNEWHVSSSVTIGKPVANVVVHIVDQGRLLSPGEVGELYIDAPSLAQGYLNQPRLTEERFVPNLFGEATGPRLYRTGDLGRCLPNGEIELLGRIDRQVKIRGFLVELREIEMALERHEGVREAVVVGHKLEHDSRLIAYLATNSEKLLTMGSVRSFLKDLLPDYMIPSSFVLLSQLPRTSSGKIDIIALPPPNSVRPLLEVAYLPARTPTETALVDIWERSLEIHGIGIHDNFADLGGDSISAARIVVDIIEQFNVELSLDALFEPGTIASVAEFCESESQADEVPV